METGGAVPIESGYEVDEVPSKVIGTLLIFFYCFFCTPARQMSPAQLSSTVSNGTGLVDMQSLSVPDCYGSKWKSPVEMLPYCYVAN